MELYNQLFNKVNYYCEILTSVSMKQPLKPQGYIKGVRLKNRVYGIKRFNKR